MKHLAISVNKCKGEGGRLFKGTNIRIRVSLWQGLKFINSGELNETFAKLWIRKVFATSEEVSSAKVSQKYKI
jgi:hypothetical protein